ncbi:MAG: hypothetical protein M3680_02240 [Myxococcota bacterium]|nr:hypothetical protein [Myxococcota bacterium]
MIVGRDGTQYTTEDVDRAKRAAAAGDVAAQQLVDNVDRTAEFADRDPTELMRQLVHDCPECRAEAARGIQPSYGTGALLEAARPPRPKVKQRRWREQRRR